MEEAILPIDFFSFHTSLAVLSFQIQPLMICKLYLLNFYRSVYNKKQPGRALPLNLLCEPNRTVRPAEPVTTDPSLASPPVHDNALFASNLVGAPAAATAAAAAARLLAPAVVIVSLRTFLCVWNAMTCSLGPNRQMSATVALRDTDTHSVVS